MFRLATKHIEALRLKLPCWGSNPRPHAHQLQVANFGSRLYRKDGVLLTDINHKTLEGEISELVKMKYHSRVPYDNEQNAPNKIECFMYGRNNQTICPTAVTHGDNSYFVFFLVDPGSPVTYLSSQVDNPTSEISE